MPKVNILYDYSWGFHRSKHAYNHKTAKISGVVYDTGPLYGIMREMNDLVTMYPELVIYLCVDGVPLKSLLVNADYKGDRIASTSEHRLSLSINDVAMTITNQFPAVVHAFHSQMEADEVIAFLCDTLPREEIKIIYSTDGDLRQKVSKELNIYSAKQVIQLPGAGKALSLEDEEYLYTKGPIDLQELYPYAIPMYKAIKGDSDNIIGIERYPTKDAKKVALRYPTPDLLRKYLKELEAHGIPSRQDQILLENLPKISNNYYQTLLDPQEIPVLSNSFDFDDNAYIKKYIG